MNYTGGGAKKIPTHKDVGVGIDCKPQTKDVGTTAAVSSFNNQIPTRKFELC